MEAKQDTNTFSDGNWLAAWACPQQRVEPDNMPPPPGLAGNTLRQVIRLSTGGNRLRVHISNLFGDSPMTVLSAALARSAKGSAVIPGTAAGMTFGGDVSVTVPAGTAAVSDPLDFKAVPLDDLAVSIRFGNVPPVLTGHPGSRMTSFLKHGDGLSKTVLDGAVETDHWYVLSGIDVLTTDKCAAVAVLGDSITDGRGSTTNGNDRWPDNLARRIQADPRTRGLSVLNMGIGGNSVVTPCLGPPAAERFDRDILGPDGVRWCIILEGVNDIGTNTGKNITGLLINAYREFIRKAHARDIRVYGVPILPFGGSHYDTPEREEARCIVNEWIRTSGFFDAVIDLDAAVRDPGNPKRLLPDYDSGDLLHLSPAGYRRMAGAVDLGLFLIDL